MEENQKNLEIKYNEAIGFYKEKKELMLSVTYRKGNLRYSFHPVDLIQYVAEYVLKHNGEEWRAKNLNRKMSGIECINLLAFIQFIIAFDFGLYYRKCSVNSPYK